MWTSISMKKKVSIYGYTVLFSLGKQVRAVCGQQVTIPWILE